MPKNGANLGASCESGKESMAARECRVVLLIGKAKRMTTNARCWWDGELEKQLDDAEVVMSEVMNTDTDTDGCISFHGAQAQD
jgi:hypothetical protein